MAITVINSPDRMNPDDAVYRQQVAHARRQDPTDTYKFEDIQVEYGPKRADGKRERGTITLRYALDGTFVFAVYADNKDWINRDRDEWEAGARNAIEKFCATRNIGIKFGPRPEDGNRYNMMAEVSGVIEYAESTVVLLQQNREAALRAREAYDRQIGR